MATSLVNPRRASDYGGTAAPAAAPAAAVDPRVQQLIDAGYPPEEAEAIVAGAPSPAPAAESVTGGRFSDYAPYPADTGNGFPMSQVNSSEPGKMAEQDRTMAYSMGSEIDSDLQDRSRGQAADERYFKQKALDEYGRLADTPGYTAEESGDIARKQQWEDLNWNPADEQRLQLTDEEKAGVMGNPRAGFDYYDPAFTQDIANSTSGNVRGAFGYGQDVMNETLQNTDALQQGAFDPSRIRFSDGVGSEIDNTVETGTQRARSAVDYGKMAIDPNFKAKYEMSDAEREGIVGRAQRQVGTHYRALQDDVELNAAQSGNASPAAVAAMKSRLARQSAVDMADARADADIAARAAQRNTFKNAEDMRLQAEQVYAQTASTIEADLLAKGVDAKLAKEKARIAAEQEVARLQADTAKNISQQHIDNASEQQKRQMGMEFDLGKQEQDANLANQKTGIALAQDSDQSLSDRTKDIAGNRQDVAQYAMNEKYKRGVDINTAISKNTQTVADAKRADQKEVRGFLTGSQETAGNNVNTANQQRVATYGTMTGAANNATQNKQQYELGKSSQGFGTAFKRAVANFAVNGVKGGN